MRSLPLPQLSATFPVGRHGWAVGAASAEAPSVNKPRQ
jgi:hypothetical protein